MSGHLRTGNIRKSSSAGNNNCFRCWFLKSLHIAVAVAVAVAVIAVAVAEIFDYQKIRISLKSLAMDSYQHNNYYLVILWSLREDGKVCSYGIPQLILQLPTSLTLLYD